MTREGQNYSVATKKGEELEVNPGGDLLTSKIIFDRPDLLEKCPQEIQDAIKLYHVAQNFFSIAQYEKCRSLIEEALDRLNTR